MVTSSLLEAPDRPATTLPTILVVDDEPLVARALERLLRRSYDVLTVGSPEMALAAVDHVEVAAVFSDQRMPGMGGADLIATIRRRDPRVMGLLITAYADIDAAAAAINDAGVVGYLRKPWRDDQVLDAVRKAVSAHDEASASARQEVELLQQEETVRVLVDQSPIAVALLSASPQLAFVRANSLFRQLVPTLSDTLLELSLGQVLDREAAEHIGSLCHRAARTGQVLTSPELKWKTPDGSVRYVACTVSPLGSVPMADDAQNRFVLTVMDLTATIASREEALAAAARQTAILEQLPSGVVVVDADGHTLFSNDIARRLQLTYEDPSEADPLRGPRDGQTGQPLRHDELPLARALTGQRVTDFDYRQDLPSGADSWIRTSAAPVLNPQNEICGAVAVCTEVTAERLADQARNIALASAGHELRTPLRSALGIAGMLIAGELGFLSPKQVEAVGRIQSSMERLHLLVEDGISIIAIESGHSGLRPSWVDLCALLARTVESFQPKIRRKHQEIVLDRPPHAIVVWADEQRLEEVLEILVSNAHNYTLDGGRITLTAVQDQAGTLVTVKDTGVGLAPAEIDNLFTKFYRARNPATWDVPGSGLGLAIARALIERQGGSISVLSAPGQGSTFKFRLPLGRVQH